MKPSLFYVSFILFINTSGIAFAIQDVVRDVNGKEVLNDILYHIGPLSPDNGGGFKLNDTKDNKKICPYIVVQEPSPSNLGGKFKFALINGTRPPNLLTSHILSIDSGFLKAPKCEDSTTWKIRSPIAQAPDNLVTTGGWFSLANTCFELVEYPKPANAEVHSYMLQHCPCHCYLYNLQFMKKASSKRRAQERTHKENIWGTCIEDRDTCYNISIYIDDKEGVRRLATKGSTPFEFVFHEVPKN